MRKTYEEDPLTNGACSGLAFADPDVGAELLLLEPVGGFLLRRLLLSERGPLFGLCGCGTGAVLFVVVVVFIGAVVLFCVFAVMVLLSAGVGFSFFGGGG